MQQQGQMLEQSLIPATSSMISSVFSPPQGISSMSQQQPLQNQNTSSLLNHSSNNPITSQLNSMQGLIGSSLNNNNNNNNNSQIGEAGGGAGGEGGGAGGATGGLSNNNQAIVAGGQVLSDHQYLHHHHHPHHHHHNNLHVVHQQNVLNLNQHAQQQAQLQLHSSFQQSPPQQQPHRISGGPNDHGMGPGQSQGANQLIYQMQALHISNDNQDDQQQQQQQLQSSGNQFNQHHHPQSQQPGILEAQPVSSAVVVAQYQQGGGSSSEPPTSLTFPSLTAQKLVWHRVESGGISPSRRNCHTATLFGHYLVIFGGREGDGRRKMVNDIHILDVEKLQWSVPIIEGKTQPRMGHSAQLYDGKIVIFGGWNGFKVLDDVVFIDLKNGIQSLHFNSPAVRGEAPRRQFHTANIIQDRMYVFGGGDAKYWLNDLDMLNLWTLQWNKCETKGTPPAGRLQHSAVAFGQKIFIYGGEPDRSHQLNDLFILDTVKLTWIQPIVQNCPPTARVSSSSCLVGSKIYFFGGYDGHNWLNDLHVLDAQHLRWQHPKIFGQLPHPRCRHTANLIYGKMLVFGGNDVDTSYNDLYFLPINVQVPQSDLRQNFHKMFKEEIFTDVTFIVDKIHKLKAHRCVLASRSEFFKTMFTVGLKQTTDYQEVQINDVKFSTFKGKQVYKALLSLHSLQLNADLALDVMRISNQYRLQHLKAITQKYLSRHKNLQNIINLLILSDQHEAVELKRICLDFAQQNFDIVIKKSEFSTLPKSLMLELLQRK